MSSPIHKCVCYDRICRYQYIYIEIHVRQQLILYYCPKSFHYPGSPRRTLAKCTNAKKKQATAPCCTWQRAEKWQPPAARYRLSAPQNFLFGANAKLIPWITESPNRSLTDINKWVCPKMMVYPYFWPVAGEHDEQEPELGYLIFRRTQMFPDVWRIDWPVYWSFVSRPVWDFTLTAAVESCNDIPLFLGIMTVIHYIYMYINIYTCSWFRYVSRIERWDCPYNIYIYYT